MLRLLFFSFLFFSFSVSPVYAYQEVGVDCDSYNICGDYDDTDSHLTHYVRFVEAGCFTTTEVSSQGDVGTYEYSPTECRLYACDDGGNNTWRLRSTNPYSNIHHVLSGDCNLNTGNFVRGVSVGEPCGPCRVGAEAECGSNEDIIWIDQGNCEYECNDPCADANPKPEDDCNGIENVIWDNVDNCEYHCDNGDCEDEYQAAKANCDAPQLLDQNTCEFTCDCPESRAAAEEACTEGYFLNPETCEFSCKCCDVKADDCVSECNGQDNVSYFNCEQTGLDSDPACSVNSSTYDCQCAVPPVDDEPFEDPEPDPDAPGDPGDPEDPEDPENPPPGGDPDPDPVGPPEEPGDPSDPDEGDGDNNGWLEEIENNTDRTADNVEKSNEWLKAVKHNTDEILEDTDNISENVRRSMSNDKGYFIDKNGRSVFKDADGSSYLKTIADGIENIGNAEDPLPSIETTGSGVLPDDNVYDPIFGEGFEPVPEDTFSQGLSDYIATGIPMISWLEGSTFNLSSSSPVITFTFFGDSFSVDFSPYQSVIDIMGTLLFYVTVLSSLMMIITRVKG